MNSKRLSYRLMEVSDREPLSEILKDPLTMTPYEGPLMMRK